VVIGAERGSGAKNTGVSSSTSSAGSNASRPSSRCSRPGIEPAEPFSGTLRRADHQQINRIRRTWRAAFIDPQQG
jgi:hypothetical protein